MWSPSTIPPANRRSCVCIRTLSAPKCKIPQENPADAFSTPRDAVQSERRRALSALESITPFEEGCFAGVAKRSDHWPLGYHFHRAREASKRLSARDRSFAAKCEELPVLPRQRSQDAARDSRLRPKQWRREHSRLDGPGRAQQISRTWH